LLAALADSESAADMGAELEVVLLYRHNIRPDEKIMHALEEK
jgi:hypothetical protein